MAWRSRANENKISDSESFRSSLHRMVRCAFHLADPLHGATEIGNGSTVFFRRKEAAKLSRIVSVYKLVALNFPASVRHVPRLRVIFVRFGLDEPHIKSMVQTYSHAADRVNCHPRPHANHLLFWLWQARKTHRLANTICRNS